MPKEINALAIQGDIWLAYQVGIHGRRLSPLEAVLERYYIHLANLEFVMKKRATKRRITQWDELTFKHDVLAKVQRDRKVICDLFIEAVDNYDGQKIMEIAKAVWRFRGIRKAILEREDFEYVDRERAMLSFLKAMLSVTGKTMSPRKAAEFITGNGNPDKDKIDTIREMGRDMGFPFDKVRKISKK